MVALVDLVRTEAERVISELIQHIEMERRYRNNLADIEAQQADKQKLLTECMEFLQQRVPVVDWLDYFQLHQVDGVYQPLPQKK